MRDGLPSFTAAAVAAARAIAAVDPVAPDLVDGPLAWVVKAARSGRGAAAAVNVGLFGLVDHLAMRTLAIDLALSQGVASGIAQLVVLGAGLDARAWRMPELAEVRAFEVDHPSTQAHKRLRIGSRLPAARGVTFVAVDFARDSLEVALARAGHDAGAPTFWLWEGVTPYLVAEARRATLAAVAARSAPGSRIAVTYVVPETGALRGALSRFAPGVFWLLGEALVGSTDVETMRADLAAAGYRVLEDSSSREWADRHCEGRRRLMLVPERLAVAVTGELPRASRAA